MNRIVVLGGGVAGLLTALLLARRGTRVVLLERDGGPPGELDGIAAWSRPGAAQVRQLHAFLGLFRKHLRDHAPDVLADLLAHGAEEIMARTPVGAERDDELGVVAARRPVVEWALHRAIAEEPNITVHFGTSARRVVTEAGRITGVQVRSGLVEANVLIDASGRRSPFTDDFTELVVDTDCGVVYNTRFYRLREGVGRPGLTNGVTTQVSGAAYGAGLFYHDNRTFAIGLGRHPDDTALKPLREADLFERAVALFTDFEPWLAGADPITDVVPMAGLRNTLRALSSDAPAGYLPIGDALCTTDPSLGRGCSIAAAQALRVAGALSTGAGPSDCSALTAELAEQVRPWLEDSVATDNARTRVWTAALSGAEIPVGPPAVPTADGLTLVAAGDDDPVLWRAGQRCTNLLDPVTTLRDPAITERLRALWRTGWRPPVPTGPSRADLVAAVEA